MRVVNMLYEIKKGFLKFTTKDDNVRQKKEADLAYEYGKITADEKEKTVATIDNEPYIKVLQVDFEDETPNVGSFELDWNEDFISVLTASGYIGKNDEQIIDQWFNDVCRNILLEEFNDQNFVANVPTEVKRSDGKSERY